VDFFVTPISVVNVRVTNTSQLRKSYWGQRKSRLVHTHTHTHLHEQNVIISFHINEYKKAYCAVVHTRYVAWIHRPALALGGYRDKYLPHSGGLLPLRIIGNWSFYWVNPIKGFLLLQFYKPWPHSNWGALPYTHVPSPFYSTSLSGTVQEGLNNTVAKPEEVTNLTRLPKTDNGRNPELLKIQTFKTHFSKVTLDNKINIFVT